MNPTRVAGLGIECVVASLLITALLSTVTHKWGLATSNLILALICAVSLAALRSALHTAQTKAATETLRADSHATTIRHLTEAAQTLKTTPSADDAHHQRVSLAEGRVDIVLSDGRTMAAKRKQHHHTPVFVADPNDPPMPSLSDVDVDVLRRFLNRMADQ